MKHKPKEDTSHLLDPSSCSERMLLNLLTALLPRHGALVLAAPGTVSVLAGHDQKWLGSDFSMNWEVFQRAGFSFSDVGASKINGR